MIPNAHDPHCQKCPLHTHIHNCVCMPGVGSMNAKILVVSDTPYGIDDHKGEPLSGSGGKLFFHVLNKLGIHKRHLFLTHAIRCRPNNNKLPSPIRLRENFKECSTYLKAEIKHIKPAVILSLGSVPLNLMMGLSSIGQASETLSGEYEGVPVVPGYHPNYVLRNPSKEVDLARSIQLAAEIADIQVVPKGLEGGMFDYESI